MIGLAGLAYNGSRGLGEIPRHPIAGDYPERRIDSFRFHTQSSSVSIPDLCRWPLVLRRSDRGTNDWDIPGILTSIEQESPLFATYSWLGRVFPMWWYRPLWYTGTFPYQRESHSARSITFIDRHVSTFLVPNLLGTERQFYTLRCQLQDKSNDSSIRVILIELRLCSVHEGIYEARGQFLAPDVRSQSEPIEVVK